MTTNGVIKYSEWDVRVTPGGMTVYIVEHYLSYANQHCPSFLTLCSFSSIINLCGFYNPVFIIEFSISITRKVYFY